MIFATLITETFKEVKGFKYLGTTINSLGSYEKETQHRLVNANKYCYSLKKLISFKLLSIPSKLRCYDST